VTIREDRFIEQLGTIAVVTKSLSTPGPGSATIVGNRLKTVEYQGIGDGQAIKIETEYDFSNYFASINGFYAEVPTLVKLNLPPQLADFQTVGVWATKTVGSQSTSYFDAGFAYSLKTLEGYYPAVRRRHYIVGDPSSVLNGYASQSLLYETTSCSLLVVYINKNTGHVGQSRLDLPVCFGSTPTASFTAPGYEIRTKVVGGLTTAPSGDFVIDVSDRPWAYGITVVDAVIVTI
jgi:hypothetical protein